MATTETTLTTDAWVDLGATPCTIRCANMPGFAGLTKGGAGSIVEYTP